MFSDHAIDPPESMRYACGFTFGEMKRRASEHCVEEHMKREEKQTDEVVLETYTGTDIRGWSEQPENNPAFLQEIAAQLADLNHRLDVLIGLLKNRI